MSHRSRLVPPFALGLLALLAPLPTSAALPEFDRSAASLSDARGAASLSRLRTDPALRRIGHVAHVDERYGVPNFVWVAPTSARGTAAAPTSRAAAARTFLGNVAPLYGLDARDVREAPLRHLHDTGRGGVIAAFTQRVNGVDVFRDELKVLMDRSGRMLAATGSIPSQAALGRAPLAFALRASDAVGKALDDFAGGTMPRTLTARGTVEGHETFAPSATLTSAAGLTPDREIRAKKVYFHEGGTLVPGWYVELLGEQQAYSYVIADGDGSILFRHSLMANHNYRVWASPDPPFLPHDGPLGTTPTPHPTGVAGSIDPWMEFFIPPFIAPSLVSLQNSPFSHNDPWLPPGATVTLGNNVDAYADLIQPDGLSPGDFRATTTSAGTFDRTYDPALAPNASTTQRMASVTQLFYDVNFFHDWYYDSGFDEASGNAQWNNLGRGGVGGDRVLAEAQDYSYTNNANITVPSDGGSPRIQMFVWDVMNGQSNPETKRDGALDNQVLAHEYGHLISMRLIGNGNGLFGWQGRGLGEGWGDFHTMLLTVRPEDASVPSNANYNGVYSTGGYSVGSSLWDNMYYWGIRRLPYSTDMTKNGLTFKHIVEGVPLPSGQPARCCQDGTNNVAVHAMGEVWCTMLWECYAGLLRDTGRLTFEQAQSRMKDYLIASYKLTPSSPNWVEARDALLAVAYASDPADGALFWTAFAKRGMGVGAVAPDRNALAYPGPVELWVVESFAAGGDVAFVSADVTDDLASCDNDGYLDEGESGTLTITLQNIGAVPLDNTTATVTSATPGLTFPAGTTIHFPSSAAYSNTVGMLPVKLQGAGPGPITLSFQVSYGDPAQATPNPQNATVHVYGRANEVASATETMEERLPGFTLPQNPAYPHVRFSKLEVAAGDHGLFAPNSYLAADAWAVSPPLDVAPAGDFTITFSHAFRFERLTLTDAIWFIDGGLIELNNGGATWRDIGAFASPGYNETLRQETSNPLTGRNAFAGESPSYPASNLVTVNLGTQYAGQTVRIRFRIGCDPNLVWPNTAWGWLIDDIAFTNITNQPFQAVVGDPSVCSQTAVGDDLPTQLAFAIDGAMPARGDVTLRFALPSVTHVQIAMFDVAGRKVAMLADGTYEPGRHGTTWKRGAAGGSGVYFARMIAGGRTLTQRVLVLR